MKGLLDSLGGLVSVSIMMYVVVFIGSFFIDCNKEFTGWEHPNIKIGPVYEMRCHWRQ